MPGPSPRPPPPPPDAVMLDKTQVAGYLGVRVRRIDELRRSDVGFPAPRLIGPGTAQWLRRTGRRLRRTGSPDRHLHHQARFSSKRTTAPLSTAPTSRAT